LGDIKEAVKIIEKNFSKARLFNNNYYEGIFEVVKGISHYEELNFELSFFLFLIQLE